MAAAFHVTIGADEKKAHKAGVAGASCPAACQCASTVVVPENTIVVNGAVKCSDQPQKASTQPAMSTAAVQALIETIFGSTTWGTDDDKRTVEDELSAAQHGASIMFGEVSIVHSDCL